MTPARTLKTALRALRRNVTRSALTVLGIVIGIAAVIAMMEIGKGSSTSIATTIASMGANNLLIMPGQAASGGVSYGAGSQLTLTEDDAEAVMRDCPGLSSAAPIVRARTQVIYQDKNWVPQSILGTSPDYLDVRSWTNLADGDMFSDADLRNAARVCLVGQTLVREVFGGRSPVGQEIRIQSVGFKVIGVLSPKGANAYGMDQDDIVIAPWTTIRARVARGGQGGGASSGGNAAATATGNSLYPGATNLYPQITGSLAANQATVAKFVNIDQIIAAARSPQQIKPAIAQITEVLRERHRLRPGEPEDFSIRDMTEGSNALAEATGKMTQLLLAVALISLIVGGVGIMNIMLVSVTERTREIGLRMAVGARSRDILLQFLAEATVLCLIGGVIGLALGRGTAWMVHYYLGWRVETSVEAIIASIGVSAFVGIVFGFYPASKASKLDPIEALRYE
jgi:ABC-type antimicrobial peptide transport system permease subunit